MARTSSSITPEQAAQALAVAEALGITQREELDSFMSAVDEGFVMVDAAGDTQEEDLFDWCSIVGEGIGMYIALRPPSR